ncbi:allophanate hydrolase [Collibacillus ludicampi]|uniref:Allophanate hydrolase n=1 Tax=Collibacillus ludicampi TaxID=2771369 RepID=A0AAV4LCW7_9BACL|nr:5-oxoprolinase subunit PxpB [Collibacillus ludicampi]GIM45513.1 allophanate hydrolase [Collibacillus ludicampi]
MTLYRPARMLPLGDRGLLVEFGDEISPLIHDHVRALSKMLDAEPIQGIIEWVPTYRSLAVYYDPLIIGYRELAIRLSDLLDDLSLEEMPPARLVEIPVLYGGEFGPDLEDVAKHCGMSVEEVVKLHSGAEYLIYMLGFSPGFPYLGGMDERLATPRLEKPRLRIPAGSVGIADKQTGVYPSETPGGWRIIGRTPLKLYDPTREHPVLLSAGDRVRFVPIDAETYEKIANSQKVNIVSE